MSILDTKINWCTVVLCNLIRVTFHLADTLLYKCFNYLINKYEQNKSLISSKFINNSPYANNFLICILFRIIYNKGNLIYSKL